MDWKLISASNHCGAMNKMLQYLLIWETSLSDEMPYHCYQVRECWQASYLIQSAHKLTDIDVEGVSLLTAAQARLIENKSQNERQKPSWFNTQQHSNVGVEDDASARHLRIESSRFGGICFTSSQRKNFCRSNLSVRSSSHAILICMKSFAVALIFASPNRD